MTALRLDSPVSTRSVTSSMKSAPLIARSNEIFKCKYVIINSGKQLGDGNFSVVKECMNIQTREIYAMKLVHKHLVVNQLNLIKREFGLLQALSNKIRSLEDSANGTGDSSSMAFGYPAPIFQGHHHILQLFDYFETNDNIILVTQLCAKDDLYEKIVSNQKLDLVRQVVPYTACLLSALQFLHNEGIVHRDIKAENILFRASRNNRTKSRIKLDSSSTMSDVPYDTTAHDIVLADFGLAARVESHGEDNGTAEGSFALKEYVGTISYIAPEIVKCKGVRDMSYEQLNELESYSYPVDIWALGVLVYFMATGYMPFDCDTDEETLECISKADYYIDDSIAEDVDYRDFWSFLRCCFKVKQDRRYTARQLQSHPFVSDFFQEENFEEYEYGLSASPSLQRVNSLTLLDANHRIVRPSRRNSLASSNFSSVISLSPASIAGQNPNYSDFISPLSSRAPSAGGILAPQGRRSNDRSRQSLMTTPLSALGANGGGFSSITPRRTPLKGSIRGVTPMSSFRRTLSTTSLHSISISKLNSLAQPSHSTFFLDPAPPDAALMGGVFSETPQSGSNFSTTPLSLSRDNSSSKLSNLSQLEPELADAETSLQKGEKHENYRKEKIGGGATFELDSDVEDDED